MGKGAWATFILSLFLKGQKVSILTFWARQNILVNKVQRRIVQKFDRDSILDQKYKLRAAWAREGVGGFLFSLF